MQKQRLGNAAHTTDATALEYFNKVHTRAGFTSIWWTSGNDVSLTDVIFKERMLEFAMEGMAWYDLVSLHYYNPQKRIQF